MYILPSGLTAAPNKESHGGADRLTCPSVALCADNALMPNTTRQALKKNPICLLVRLRFKLFLPDSVLSSAHHGGCKVAPQSRTTMMILSNNRS
jgi:hypothetical protein